MIGRLAGTLGLITLLKLCRYNSGLNVREIIFIWYAGMIRGAIAFGLVLKIHGEKEGNTEVIVTTALMLVVFTTVFCGSTVGVLQKFLFPPEDEKEKTDKVEDEDEKCNDCGEDMDNDVKNKESLPTTTTPQDAEASSVDQSDASSYEDFAHPN